MGQREDQEESAVRDLGESIGYGRMMQLAEQIWNAKMPGAAHSSGPCVAFLVSCPCPEDGRDVNGHCDWCCGAGRVTEKVRGAIDQQRKIRAALKETLNVWGDLAHRNAVRPSERPAQLARIAELRKEFWL